jgi:hypothetical protein
VADDRHRGEHGPTTAELTLEGHHPSASGSNDAVVRGHVRERTTRPPTSDRAVDEVGSQRDRRIGIDTPTRGARRWSRDDEHVGARYESMERGEGAGIAEIEHDTALAPQPQRARRQRPEPIATGRLDLDHLSAEVGEDHRRHATHRAAGQVDDAQAFEDVRHGARR